MTTEPTPPQSYRPLTAKDGNFVEGDEVRILSFGIVVDDWRHDKSHFGTSISEWLKPLSDTTFEARRPVKAQEAQASTDGDRALADKALFVFDVESIGLHGEGFSVGWVVVKSGAEFEASYLACDRGLARGADADRAWVDKNVPVQAITHSSPLAVRNAFWLVWRQWQANGAIMVADCAWPVEARFLAQCVDDAPSERTWDGPYPLHDAASLMLAFGEDPLATNERLDSEKPAHNPLCDARQTARMIHEASLNHAAHTATAVAEACKPLEEKLLAELHSRQDIQNLLNRLELDGGMCGSIESVDGLVEVAKKLESERDQLRAMTVKLQETLKGVLNNSVACPHGVKVAILEALEEVPANLAVAGAATSFDKLFHEAEQTVGYWKEMSVLADERVAALEAENTKLREALTTIADGIDEDDSGLTLRTVQRYARKALAPEGKEGGSSA